MVWFHLGGLQYMSQFTHVSPSAIVITQQWHGPQINPPFPMQGSRAMLSGSRSARTGSNRAHSYAAHSVLNALSREVISARVIVTMWHPTEQITSG